MIFFPDTIPVKTKVVPCKHMDHIKSFLKYCEIPMITFQVFINITIATDKQ